MGERIERIDSLSKAKLSDKQSVRTTFKLSKNVINKINEIIKKNNLKPKELFDIMCSDEKIIDSAVMLDQKNGISNSSKKIRKTYVISRYALRLFNRASKKHNVPRDLIVENVVLIAENLFKKIEREERRKEKKAFEIIQKFLSNAEDVEKKLQDLLEDDNPIIDRFGYVVVILSNLVSAIESKLSDGTPIDPFEF